MQCESCHAQEGTIFLTKIVNGEATKTVLCEQCASDQGVFNWQEFVDAAQEIAQGIQEKNAAEEQAQKNTTPSQPTCPECGFTATNLHKIGRLGCAACYDLFLPSLTSRLGQMHTGTRHTGRQPKGKEHLLTREQLGQLRQELEIAIQDENFETAAKLRDDIQHLEHKLTQST